ncbi:MAG: hypothetical protein FWF58_01425 [Firmicutes bacterium]|nr:hypothetical protein [Bacillota bacterium]
MEFFKIFDISKCVGIIGDLVAISTTILLGIVTILSISLSIKKDKIWGVDTDEFDKLKVRKDFDLLDMFFVALGCVVAGITALVFGLFATSVFVFACSIVYSIIFARQDIPYLLRQDKRLWRIVGQRLVSYLSDKNNISRNDGYYQILDTILLHQITEIKIDKVYTNLKKYNTLKLDNQMQQSVALYMLYLQFKSLRHFEDDNSRTEFFSIPKDKICQSVKDTIKVILNSINQPHSESLNLKSNDVFDILTIIPYNKSNGLMYNILYFVTQIKENNDIDSLDMEKNILEFLGGSYSSRKFGEYHRDLFIVLLHSTVTRGQDWFLEICREIMERNNSSYQYQHETNKIDDYKNACVLIFLWYVDCIVKQKFDFSSEIVDNVKDFVQRKEYREQEIFYGKDYDFYTEKIIERILVQYSDNFEKLLKILIDIVDSKKYVWGRVLHFGRDAKWKGSAGRTYIGSTKRDYDYKTKLLDWLFSILFKRWDGHYCASIQIDCSAMTLKGIEKLQTEYKQQSNENSETDKIEYNGNHLNIFEILMNYLKDTWVDKQQNKIVVDNINDDEIKNTQHKIWNLENRINGSRYDDNEEKVANKNTIELLEIVNKYFNDKLKDSNKNNDTSQNTLDKIKTNLIDSVDNHIKSLYGYDDSLLMDNVQQQMSSRLCYHQTDDRFTHQYNSVMGKSTNNIEEWHINSFCETIEHGIYKEIGDKFKPLERPSQEELIKKLEDFNPTYTNCMYGLAYIAKQRVVQEPFDVKEQNKLDKEFVEKINYIYQKMQPKDFSLMPQVFWKDGAVKFNFEIDKESTIVRQLTADELTDMIDKDYNRFDGRYLYENVFVTREELYEELNNKYYGMVLVFKYTCIVDKNMIFAYKY